MKYGIARYVEYSYAFFSTRMRFCNEQDLYWLHNILFDNKRKVMAVL